MIKVRQAFSVAAYDFRQWHRNPRIIVTFALVFIMCFLLSDKAVRFAVEHNTTMQIMEAFIWTFGDSNSILLSSLLLVMLFADMPFLSPGTPFYLIRTTRKVWITGQMIYTVAATGIYLLFILFSTALVCERQSFLANMWSPTAAILGYSGAGEQIALPAMVKTLEMTYPYRCTATIFLLMLGYALTMVFIMLVFNLRFGQAAGVISVFVFSVYGFLLSPTTIDTIFDLPPELFYKANVAVGWLSPLNHATYHMHNFGYDLLPELWESFAIFGVIIAVGYIAALRAVKSYNFNFRGTEN